MLTPINDHQAAALKRLIGQYFDSTNLRKLISALVGPMQTVETVENQLNTMCDIANAQGIQLDRLGVNIGLKRTPGDDDETYRRKLYAKIKINTSQGQPEQAIQMFQLFTNATQVRLFELDSGEVIIESPFDPENHETTNLLLDLLTEVLPAGVRPDAIVVYDEGAPFCYAGALQPQAGYGSVSDPLIGGVYPNLKVHYAPFGYGVNNVTIRGYGTVLDPYVGGAYAT